MKKITNILLLLQAITCIAVEVEDQKILIDYNGCKSEIYADFRECKALHSYKKESSSGTSYKLINKHLRGLYTPKRRRKRRKIRDRIVQIQSAIKKHPPLSGELFLFRGGGVEHRNGKKFRVGEVLHEKGFTSTSINPYVGIHFSSISNRKYRSRRNAIFLIFTHENYEGFYFGDESYRSTNPTSGYDSEEEVLLASSSTFKVERTSVYTSTSHSPHAEFEIVLLQYCLKECSSDAVPERVLFDFIDLEKRAKNKLNLN